VAEYELGAGEVEVLRLAAESLDRADEARRALDKDGLFVAMKGGGLRSHPAVAVERDSRLAAARLLRQLGLDDDAATPANRRHRSPDRKAAR
jgi:hypothetical protein